MKGVVGNEVGNRRRGMKIINQKMILIEEGRKIGVEREKEIEVNEIEKDIYLMMRMIVERVVKIVKDLFMVMMIKSAVMMTMNGTSRLIMMSEAENILRKIAMMVQVIEEIQRKGK